MEVERLKADLEEQERFDKALADRMYTLRPRCGLPRSGEPVVVFEGREYPGQRTSKNGYTVYYSPSATLEELHRFILAHDGPTPRQERITIMPSPEWDTDSAWSCIRGGPMPKNIDTADLA